VTRKDVYIPLSVMHSAPTAPNSCLALDRAGFNLGVDRTFLSLDKQQAYFEEPLVPLGPAALGAPCRDSDLVIHASTYF
jgi:hypothetical protein